LLFLLTKQSDGSPHTKAANLNAPTDDETDAFGTFSDRPGAIQGVLFYFCVK
jgi:hypothetical protein